MESELITAVLNNDLFKVIHLLKTGTDPNVCEDGEGVTALHFIAQVLSQDAFIMARALVIMKASLDVKTAEGLTPLDVAQLHQNTRFLEWANSQKSVAVQ